MSPISGSGPVTLRAEWRRVASTRLWWALLIPVAVLAAAREPLRRPARRRGRRRGGDLPVLLGVGRVHADARRGVRRRVRHGRGRGRVPAPHRHHRLPRRGRPRARCSSGKLVAGAASARCTRWPRSWWASPRGWPGSAAGGVPGPRCCSRSAAIGVAVAALWGVIGAALGDAAGEPGGRARRAAGVPAGRRAGARGGAEQRGSPAAARLTPYLPGNARRRRDLRPARAGAGRPGVRRPGRRAAGRA